MRTLKFKAQPTNEFFRLRQPNVRRLLPACDYCQALFRCLNCAQRFDYRPLGSRRKLGEDTEHSLTVAKNAFVGWALNVRVCMLLKGAEISKNCLHTVTNVIQGYYWRHIWKRACWRYGLPIRIPIKRICLHFLLYSSMQNFVVNT